MRRGPGYDIIRFAVTSTVLRYKLERHVIAREKLEATEPEVKIL